MLGICPVSSASLDSGQLRSGLSLSYFTGYPNYVPVNLGTAFNGGRITSLAATAVGSTILVTVYDFSDSGPASPSVYDSVGNTYTLVTSQAINNVDSTNGSILIYSSVSTVALAVGSTVTYTSNSVNPQTSSQLSVTNIYTYGQPISIDTAVTAKSFGSSTAATVTSGTPTKANEYFIGFLFSSGFSGVINPSGWSVSTSPPIRANAGYDLLGGQVNTTTSPLTFAQTLTSTSTWAVIIIAYKY